MELFAIGALMVIKCKFACDDPHQMLGVCAPLDIVILPPQAAHNDSDEDEGTEEDCLDEDYLPTDVPGEIEIHHDELNNEADEDMSDENSDSRWRKNESLTIPMHSRSSNFS